MMSPWGAIKPIHGTQRFINPFVFEMLNVSRKFKKYLSVGSKVRPKIANVGNASTDANDSECSWSSKVI